MPRAFFLFASLILLCTIAGAAGESGSGMELKLASGAFRPLQAAAPLPDWYSAEAVDRSASGKRYLVAITAGAIGLEQRRRLEALGAKLLDYIPENGYRLSMPAAVEDELRALDFVEWLGPLPPYMKVPPQLAAAVGVAVEAAQVRIVLNAGEPAERVLEALAGMNAHARPSGKDGAWRIEVTIPPDRIAALLSQLSALPEVEAVEPVLPLLTFNQDAVWVHQSFVGPSPQEIPVYSHGIFGCDQIVAVADTGQDYDACYFRDDLNGPPPVYTCLFAPCPAGTPDLLQRKDIIYYNWSDTQTGDDDTCPATIGGSGHGTHTSGSVAGDSPGYADCASYATAARNGGDGQAPGARLVMQELGDGLEYLNYGGGTIWNMADIAYQSGARIHSISWGGVCHDLFGTCVEGCTLPYDSFARDADLAMWNYPDLLMVNAAGNSGQFCPSPNAVNTPGTAKSPLTVGAVGHGANAGTPSSFTSPGPVFDGRLKPTVAAQGEATVSAASDAFTTTNNCGTCSLDGSSMSAPTTAGLAALVREYYTAGYYVAGERNASAGLIPTGALIKATIIDGGVPLGAAAPGPDFTSGFGRVLLGETLAFADSSFGLRVDDHRQGLTAGSVVTHAYNVADGTPFRATLVWTDYPAALNAAVARVNELMLEVVDPNGDIWFQTIDAISGAPRQTNIATDPHDTLNVEERLVFETPDVGRWVVRVRGVDVPWGPQPFALVVRGALSDCAAPGEPGAPTLTSPADDQAHISWDVVSGAAAYNVYRSYGSCPAGPWIPVATAVTGASFTDSSVVGGVTYSYYVTAASDSEAYCESAPSPCETIVPLGDCTLAPDFHGIRESASSGADPCAIVLSWDGANPYCSPDVRYNIYRSTSAGFTPGPANRVARCIVDNSWMDAAGLAYGTTYHYIVRAEDSNSGHGGPCFGGNEESNLIELSGSPDGPPVLGGWTDDAGDSGAAKFTTGPGWGVDTSGGTPGGPNVYVGASAAGTCADLTTPVLTLADPGEGPGLTFMTVHDLDYDPNGFWGREGSVGQVEIAQGPYYSPWTRVELSPDYPHLVDFPLNNCESTATVDSYFTDTDLEYSTYSASLVNWGGQDVKIRFHISGDLVYPNGYWWIDDVEVTQALVPGSCSAQSMGPPPIPDGASLPGSPMMAEKSGADLRLTWDALRCPASEVNVYYGALGDYTTFTGGECGLPANGVATVAIGDNSWFLITATDGASTDGSWSRDRLGRELHYDGAPAACPAISAHLDNNACP